MSLPAKMPAASVAEDLFDGDDDLRDVDAMFESLLNNTFDEEEEQRSRSETTRAKNSRAAGAVYAGREPTKSSAAQFSSAQRSVASGANGETMSARQQQQQQQAVCPSGGSPSPTQSEYDTACDPWDDY
jgi:hypothetical protein